MPPGSYTGMRNDVYESAKLRCRGINAVGAASLGTGSLPAALEYVEPDTYSEGPQSTSTNAGWFDPNHYRNVGTAQYNADQAQRSIDDAVLSQPAQSSPPMLPDYLKAPPVRDDYSPTMPLDKIVYGSPDTKHRDELIPRR